MAPLNQRTMVRWSAFGVQYGGQRGGLATNQWLEGAMESSSSFGYWLRRQRKALDLTQTELASRVGCAVDTIKKIEADARRPSRQLAERLALVLQILPEAQPRFLQAARGERSPDQLALATQPAE